MSGSVALRACGEALCGTGDKADCEQELEAWLR